MNHIGENLLVFFIMGGLLLIVYCKITGKTFTDVFREIKDLVSEKEVIEYE